MRTQYNIISFLVVVGLMLVIISSLFPFFIEQKSDIEKMLFQNRAERIGKSLLFSAQCLRDISFGIIGYGHDDPYLNMTGEELEPGFLLIVKGGSKLGEVMSPLYTEGGVASD